MQAVEDYKSAVANYEREPERIKEAQSDYELAKSEWRRRQKITDEEDYRDQTH